MPQTTPLDTFNWDDLRFIISVADHGSAVAAASKLGVNATTVQRRIARFEQQNAIRLFERRQTGLTPTPECEALIEATRGIGESISGIRREILGRDLRLEGRLAVTTTDTFMYREMAQHFALFNKNHPDIEIEISLTHQRLNLSRQDADIAIRPSNNPPDNLVGQRVAGLAMAVYGVPEIAANLNLEELYGTGLKAHLKALRAEKWVGLGSSLSGSSAGNIIQQIIPASKISMTVDTFTGICSAVAAGNGLGILPCIIADREPKLMRITKPIEELTVSIWVLTHPEIRGAAKIRAFMDFITKAIRGDAAILEGRLEGGL